MYKRIKDLREDNDLTQQTVADYLNIKQNAYSQYETGRRQIPLEALIKLAKYFHAPDKHPACGHIVKSWNQLNKGGFGRTCTP